MSFRQTAGVSAAFALVFHLAGCERPPAPVQERDTAFSTGVAEAPPASVAAAPAPNRTPPPTLTPPVPIPAQPATGPVPAAPPPAPPIPAGQEAGSPQAVLARWGAAIERRDWAQVRALWGNRGNDSGLGPAAFGRKWEALGQPRVSIEPGRQEGAAGSLYYETRLRIVDGKRVIEGPLVIRRVNDVPGATAEQLRWHLDGQSALRWLDPLANAKP